MTNTQSSINHAELFDKFHKLDQINKNLMRIIIRNYKKGYFLKLMTEEAGDDDLCDVGSMGTPRANTHHTLY